MSEQQPTATATKPKAGETPAPEPAGTDDQPIQLPDDHPLVKTLAEQKKAIRDLKVKAGKFDELEEAQKTEAEKAADRLTKAEARVAEAEARALRREVAIEHKLDKTDAELLDALTDEDAMRSLAARLSKAGEDERKDGNRVPTEGKTPNPTADPKRSWLRSLRE